MPGGFCVCVFFGWGGWGVFFWGGGGEGVVVAERRGEEVGSARCGKEEWREEKMGQEDNLSARSLCLYQCEIAFISGTRWRPV